MKKKHTRNNKGMRFLLVLSILFAGVAMGWSTIPASAADYPTKPVLFIAPSKPGSGFDTTARAVTATLGKEKLVPVAMPVENASSSIPGTATIVTRHKNNPYMIAVQSLAGMLNFSTGMSPYSHKDLHAPCPPHLRLLRDHRPLRFSVQDLERPGQGPQRDPQQDPLLRGRER